MCKSNQGPRFFTEYTGITSTSPTLIMLTGTLDSFLLVPITRNSALSSFNVNLSLIIHERTWAVHFSIASSASASHGLSNGRNDKYNWVSSTYECADGRWDLIILKSLLEWIVKSRGTKAWPLRHPTFEAKLFGKSTINCNLFRSTSQIGSKPMKSWPT